MPVLLMLDVMLDLMLDRVHAMTHVALRLRSTTMYRTRSLVQGGNKTAWHLSCVRHARRRAGHCNVCAEAGTIASPSVEQAALAQELEEGILRLRHHGLHARQHAGECFRQDLWHRLQHLRSGRGAIESGKYAHVLGVEVARIDSRNILHDLGQPREADALEFPAQVGEH